MNLMHATGMDQHKMARFLEHSPSIKEFYVSEKLDGIRAIWTGTSLVTRQGNTISAPDWFIAALPKDIMLEGELWAGRGQFQQVTRTVLDKYPNSNQWLNIKFMLFDMPNVQGPFSHRLSLLKEHAKTLNQPFIEVATQRELGSITELERWHKNVIALGGEGLMLHNKNNFYTAGKSPALMKFKHHNDNEAIVIGYEPGNGKYKGMMGAIWVITSDNIKFKIGTGFSDDDRQNPPPLGSFIQYRHNGFTNSGIPRFARYVRLRPSPDS
ncbi:hypothetical protein ABT56_12090 [Photobacterium aquae]|uniref:ATP-dependent DNA ligase family profile domain-containing protein n=2 Tax=Photobacterium aquae TaxID=1195763 RepID=A0A0J1H118_9GAMM|nr:hypothetical protein ABT56_12090 [Photobacterium aquae]